MNATDFGVNGGWGGLRTTKNLVNKFNVDVSALNNSLGTLSKWGLVGDATLNQWNGPDMEMHETGTNTYALYADLTAGEIKFRFDEDWGNNYGDDNTDGSLEAGGSNIPVASPGTYFITLDLNTLTYSIAPFAGDKRGMFHKDGQTLEIEEIPSFENGYAVTKFKNIDSSGNQGSDAAGDFVDTDIPLIRLAEIYLNYEEATLKGGGGDLTLDFVLDERSRELYWEGQRRTDLIRYNYFTSDTYLWPFKGDSKDGVGTDSFRNIFPLPNNIITTNPNLIQNPGY